MAHYKAGLAAGTAAQVLYPVLSTITRSPEGWSYPQGCWEQEVSFVKIDVEGQMSKFKGVYPASWTKEFRNAFRAAHDNKCERCGHPHDPLTGYALTIHHLDNDKSNCADWNLAVLCQRCHLHIQGKVEMRQGYFLEHSEWMKPHVEAMQKALEERKQ